MELPTKERLMEKYWMGESTSADEDALKALSLKRPELFSAEELNYLNGIHQVQELTLGEDFGKNLVDEFVEAEKEEAISSQVIPIWKKSWMRVAASIILLIGMLFSFQQFNSSKILSDLSAEEVAAYEETKEALLLISQKMNKIKSVTAAFAKFDETQAKIKPNINLRN